MKVRKLMWIILLLAIVAVPCLAEETVTCPECGAENPAGANYCSECGAEIASVTEVSADSNAKHYSWSTALLGNLLPGLGYFLIDEPGWALAELGVMGAGTALIIIGSQETGFMGGFGEIISGFIVISGAWLGGLIHAPLLAAYKNERAGYSLSLEPGLMLAADGSALPALTLDLRF